MYLVYISSRTNCSTAANEHIIFGHSLCLSTETSLFFFHTYSALSGGLPLYFLSNPIFCPPLHPNSVVLGISENCALDRIFGDLSA
jgi:hypothetical protein